MPAIYGNGRSEVIFSKLDNDSDKDGYPTYRKPFGLIFMRAKSKEWRALRDDFRTLVFSQPEETISELCQLR